MATSGRILLGLLVAAGAFACDSVELTIAVTDGPDGSVIVANADGRVWNDARLLVEAVEGDGSTTPCSERTVASWAVGETITVPACGEKLRLTLTTGGETARFAWAHGQLFRRFGRKEVPVAP